MKYLWFPTLGCKDIGITKSEFVAKTQFLSKKMGEGEEKEKGSISCKEKKKDGIGQ